MFLAANFISIFMFMPETKFTGSRPQILSSRIARPSSNQTPSATVIKEKEDGSVNNVSQTVSQRTWLQELQFWSKGDPDVNLLHVFLRPFFLLAYPTVVWSCFVYGLALSWNVILGATVAQLFSPPPYEFNSNAQGLFFLSPFVGSLSGYTYLGLVETGLPISLRSAIMVFVSLKCACRPAWSQPSLPSSVLSGLACLMSTRCTGLCQLLVLVFCQWAAKWALRLE
jgi:hypothetical protein